MVRDLAISSALNDAIVSKNSAHLIPDSRYWLQAREQLDQNWVIVDLVWREKPVRSRVDCGSG